MKKKRICITAAGSCGGMAILQSLISAAEFDLFLVDAEPLSHPFFLYPDIPHACVPMGSDARYVPALLEICRENHIDVIFPISDEEVIAIAKHRKDFEKISTFPLVAPLDAVELADDKVQTICAAEKVGLRVPKTIQLKTGESSANAALSLPLVVKPCVGRGGSGVSYANSYTLADDIYWKTVMTYGPSMIQECIPGVGGSIYVVGVLFDHNSQIRATFASRSLKTKYSHGGPAVVGEPVIEKELIAEAVRLLESTGPWFGPINVEFKRHAETGEFYLLEINARYWGYGFLSTGAGINFPHLSVKLALGESIQEIHSYNTNVMLVRCLEDKIFPHPSL